MGLFVESVDGLGGSSLVGFSGSLDGHTELVVINVDVLGLGNLGGHGFSLVEDLVNFFDVFRGDNSGDFACYLLNFFNSVGCAGSAGFVG